LTTDAKVAGVFAGGPAWSSHPGNRNVRRAYMQ